MKERAKTIGEVISSLRKIKKISQQDMANDLCMPLETLMEIESSEVIPETDMVETIADYFDVPLSLIIFETITTEHMKDPRVKELFDTAKPIMSTLMHYLLDATEPEIDVDINKSEISDN